MSYCRAFFYSISTQWIGTFSESEMIYSQPGSWLMMGRRYCLMFGTGVVAVNACVSMPLWGTYSSLEYGGLFLPLMGLVYGMRQDYLYNKYRTTQVQINVMLNSRVTSDNSCQWMVQWSSNQPCINNKYYYTKS